MTISWKDRLLDISGQQMTEKQTRIIIAAVELFGEQGYADTTTRQIAARAGVSEGSIFKLVASKEELLMYISRQITQHVIPLLMNHGLPQLFETPHESVEDFLHMFMKNRLEIFDSNIALMKVILQEAMFRPEIRHFFSQSLEGLHIPWSLLGDRPEQETKTIFITCFMGYVFTRYIVLPEMFAEDREKDRELFVKFMARALRA